MPAAPDLDHLQSRAADLVAAARKAGADAADAVVAISSSTGVSVRDGKVEDTESAQNNAFSLRVFVGARVASVSANQSDAIPDLAARAVAMAKVAPPDPHAGLAPKDRLAKNWHDLDLLDEAEPDFDAMRDLALACEEAALAVDGVTKSSGAGFGYGLGGSVLATSDGFTGAYSASRFSLSVSAVSGEGTGMERDYDFDSQRHFADLRSAEDIGAEAGRRAARRHGPRTIPTGKVTCLFEPRMARSLVGHLAGAVNGASIVRGTSFLREKMGEAVFSPGITITDDPHIVRGVASRPFDGEGVGGQAFDLVSNGCIANWLLDSGNAKQLDLETNGRASRGGSSTSPSSSNLALHPGKRTPEDMMQAMGTGLLVTELIGQGVSLVTGDYSRGASGFWIENGEIAFPVSEITIASNLTDMFASLEPASDLDRRQSIATPSILIEGMTLAGR
ncbi:MAG: metallopeptidase TldD-related protein [Pseudomonadota bacterium]